MRKVSLKDILVVLLGLVPWIVAWAGVVAVIAVGVALLTDTSLKDAASSVQSVGTIAAIGVAGAFTYYRLQIFRSFEPHMTITLDVSHRRISDSYVHIAITSTLLNSSKVKTELHKGAFALLQVAPMPDETVERLYRQVFEERQYEDIQWPTLDEVERTWREGELIVEPGESHQESCEFIVSADVRSVVIYAYFHNARSGRDDHASEGWGATTVYDIVTTRS